MFDILMTALTTTGYACKVFPKFATLEASRTFDGPSGEVRILIEVEGDGFHMTIADAGGQYDVYQRTPSDVLDELANLGLL